MEKVKFGKFIKSGTGGDYDLIPLETEEQGIEMLNEDKDCKYLGFSMVVEKSRLATLSRAGGGFDMIEVESEAQAREILDADKECKYLSYKMV